MKFASTPMRRLAFLIAMASVAITTLANGAVAATSVGTQAQVTNAIAMSTSITTLSKGNIEALNAARSGNADYPWRTYKGQSGGKSGCNLVTSCVFGATSSKKIVVLYGDSHASMWLPALAPWAKANNFKLVLLWQRGCPIINLGTDYKILGAADEYYGAGGVLSASQCATYRSKALAQITSLHPSLVLLGERTAQIVESSSNTLFSSQKWESALVTTITSLLSATTKIVLLGDIPFWVKDVPTCLSIHASQVQACAISYPNKMVENGVAETGQQVAEEQAASATKIGYIDTVPLLCKTSRICSPIVNSDITYYDDSHISSTYAVWVSGVLTAKIKALL